MVKNYTVLFIFFTLSICYSQKDRKLINGKIVADSLSVENIHVINKTTKIGTITNVYGEFRIPVKENDTLLVSAVQFYNQELIITNKELNSFQISIKLKPRINQIDEVVVKNHDLEGRLIIDSKNFKDDIPEATKSALDFSQFDLTKPVISNIDFVDRKRPPSASKLTNPMIPIGGGLDIVFLIKKLSNKKKIEKRKLLFKVDKSSDMVREEFCDDFFVNDLKVPLEQIDDFLFFCKRKGILELYVKGQKLEFINQLIATSKQYLKDDSDKK